MESIGIQKNKVVIDPGVGFSFGGDAKEDLMRIKMVSQLSQLKVPTMIAISRKSFLGKLFEIEVSGRLLSTILLESLMIRNGGRVLRVHDIEETKQMIDIMTCYYETLVGEL